MKRIFVVGCPRSGTTLIQALLARYPGVHSFPETGFFEALLGGIESRWKDPDSRRDSRWHHRYGFARSWGRRRLRELEIQLTGESPHASPHRVKSCIRRYVELLDRAATEHHCSAWVEKTPNHLMYVDDIAEHVGDARFVHVLRNGEDVVASIVDADLNHPTRAFRGGVKRWVRRWNYAIDLQLAHLGVERHHVLCLEDMVDDFDREWERLCTFLGLNSAIALSAEPLCRIADVAEEPWKKGAVSGVINSPARKSEGLFGPRIRDWMQSSLVPYAEVRAKIASAG